MNTKPSSRKIGERYIPSIDLKENLSPHVAYSSSMEARKLQSFAHRKQAEAKTKSSIGFNRKNNYSLNYTHETQRVSSNEQQLVRVANLLNMTNPI